MRKHNFGSRFGRKREEFNTTEIAANRALRGNTARVCEVASDGKRKVGLYRREIIKSVRAARGQFLRIAPRVALIKRMPKIGGFHVVGLGEQEQITLNELKVKLGAHGFNRYRFRGLPVQKLFAKTA